MIRLSISTHNKTAELYPKTATQTNTIIAKVYELYVAERSMSPNSPATITETKKTRKSNVNANAAATATPFPPRKPNQNGKQ